MHNRDRPCEVEDDVPPAEVRTDTGKLVASTWHVRVGTCDWWVVVGLGNALVTVIGVDPWRQEQGESNVTDGTLYAFVGGVNEHLMRAEVAH
ncbi:hypothetical protein ACFWR9_01410 [Streptomyces sp. NPDC058534]|uniref:hypothetical protein n=1 Tax=Streptomyces sp. NPDC058534 TaxID=3346541 RepID=UPI00364BF2DC